LMRAGARTVIADLRQSRASWPRCAAGDLSRWRLALGRVLGGPRRLFLVLLVPVPDLVEPDIDHVGGKLLLRGQREAQAVFDVHELHVRLPRGDGRAGAL